MAKIDPKNPPSWFLERVYNINMTLISDFGMDWIEIIRFWEDVIAEIKENSID